MRERSQEAGARSRTIWLQVCLSFLTLLVPAMRAQAGTQSPGAVVARSNFSRIWRELGTLRELELVERADELYLTDPGDTLRAMILRVGREVPATLTAARRDERLANRATAIDWISDRIEENVASLEIWEDAVRDILADSSQVIQWCAVARTLGRMGHYEFAPELSARLDSKNPRLVHAVRFALHELYLVWFADQAEFDAMWPSAQEMCQDGLFMATARTKDELARERLVLLLEYEPQRAQALLKDPDPRLRAAAATAYGRAQNGETTEAVETLLGQAATEIDGLAFQATIEALFQLRDFGQVDAPVPVRLRSILKARAEEGFADLQAPVADALRRLAWNETTEGPDSILVGVSLLAGQLAKLAAPHRLTDRDVVVTSMSSLQSLASSADRANLPIAQALIPIGGLVIDMIEDDGESDLVRIAASTLLPLVGEKSSIQRSVLVLNGRSSSPELRYNLLATVGDMANKLAADDAVTLLVLATLLDHLGGDDANLRGRALSYLTMDEYQPLLAGTDPSVFIDSLGRESVPDLQSQLLELIASFGSSENIAALIALPNFDSIAGSGPAGISSLARTLDLLAGSDGAAQVRGAARLLAVEDDATRIMRLRETLGVISVLSTEALASLSAQDNHRIVSWAMELRGAAGSLPGGEAFLARLNQNHLPGCLADTTVGDARKLAHIQALFLSDWITLDNTAGSTDEVLAHFERALQLATESGDAVERALVLRDRARYQFDRGAQVAALADYRALFSSELPLKEDASQPRSLVLVPRDLRRGADLLTQSVIETPDKTGAVHEALRVSFILIGEPTWNLEPAAVRAKDLRELAERALRIESLEQVNRARSIFASLPELPAEGAEIEQLSPPEGALWAGLTETRESHSSLLELRQRLSAWLKVLTPAKTPVENSPDKEEESQH
ncbi:MAG: hypothetical protein ACI8X5_001529 [Planctomycetota bacterium]|jgi:hypothetical protein